jgi:hypothetical protein
MSPENHPKSVLRSTFEHLSKMFLFTEEFVDSILISKKCSLEHFTKSVPKGALFI